MLDRIAAALARFAALIWQDFTMLFRSDLCPLCGEPFDEGDHEACIEWQAHR